MSRSNKREKCKANIKETTEKKHLYDLSSEYRAYELPLFENKWSIYLEILLLDALNMYLVNLFRFGGENWEDIAIYLNSTFNAEQIRDHYFRIFGEHETADSYKLPEQNKMLIAHQEDDIYVSASKKEEHRKMKEHRANKKQINSDDSYEEPQVEQVKDRNKKKIPPEFGYEEKKKIFAQPFNEEAEIMTVGLSIDKEDSEAEKANKMEVLHEYNKMITERAIIEKQVMDNNLMECKYSLHKNDLTIAIPRDEKSEISLSKKGRKKKGGPPEKPNEEQNLFFKIKRSFNEDLCDAFQVVYMKMSKYDEDGKMKQLLIQYQELCAEIKKEKDSIVESN